MSPRWHWLWEAYFGVGCLAALVAILSNTSVGAGQRLGAAVALACIIPWYLLFGRRLINSDDEGWRATAFVAGLLVLFGVSIAFVPKNSLVLFAIYPMIFMAVPLRQALPAAVVASLLPTAALIAREGPSSTFLDNVLVIPMFGMAAAVLIGTWIIRMAGVSEDRARLIEKLEATQAQVATLSHEAGTAAERARMAREIHDTLAQGFTSIVTLVQAAESELDGDTEKVRRHLALAAKTARENLAEARALVAARTPSALDAGSLEDAVRRQVERLGEETGIQAHYHTEGTASALSTAIEVVLLRAAQEALSNVRKHAGATTVSVSLRFTDAAVTLSVGDNGVGFDAAADGSGFGLRGMRTRVDQVSGTLAIDSAPGTGTRLELEVPH